ncbi:MAG: 4-(cytidine 5'-diphospho)-2-C-methyl-D-erythritol kinase [Cytophagales bacterium]
MISFPNAKINIGLNIVEKRPDGFHNLETCFVPIGWKDVLEVVENDQLEFKSFGLQIDGDVENNLCLRAFHLLNKDFRLPPVKIVLQKNIPMGGGLGGGSSDAAFTLKLLNEKFNLSIDEEKLRQYAEQLGSDCAFFVSNKPCMGYDKGNLLKPIHLNLSGFHLLVIYPKLHVSTQLAYSMVKPQKPEHKLEEVLKNSPVEEWKNLVRNDFEFSVFKAFPEIEKIKNTLYDLNATYSQMSGSGASVFGIFKEKPETDWIKRLSYPFWHGELNFE